MRIEHVALWTEDLERLKDFYTRYFKGKASQKYVNPGKGFESYFIEFENGARLELMKMPSVLPNPGEEGKQYSGYVHLAFSVGDKEAVDLLTDSLRKAGHRIVSEPRITGDGYYESCIMDPDGNRVEITV